MTVEIDLSGKVAIVTGAGRGIGKAIALRLAEAGADVCVTARTVAEIEATAQGVRQIGRAAVAVQGDATDAIAVGEVVGKTITALGGPPHPGQQRWHGTAEAPPRHDRSRIQPRDGYECEEHGSLHPGGWSAPDPPAIRTDRQYRF